MSSRAVHWSSQLTGKMPVPHLAHGRRGMMLVVTLVIVTLLALLGASFAFRMNADVAAVTAQHDLQQARQAAESGIDRAIMVLRDQRTDMDQWWNNPKLFRRILVWAPDKIGGSESVADQEAVPGRPAWRFSIISYRLDGDIAKIRYGVSDEAGKINLNTASRAQLISLFDNVKRDENVLSTDLADAVLQWRGDKDVNPAAEAKLTEFYNKQSPPYKPKQRPFETVEELLMVKGFDGQFLYGEDYNRNGYLDPNEDDGTDGAFPPDDGDGKLNRGLLPLVTVYSWDLNAANDNRQRVNINVADLSDKSASAAAAAATGMKVSVRDMLSTEIRPEVLDFIAEARKRNYKFKSIGEMVGLKVYQDGSSNYDKLWKRFLRQIGQADKQQEAEPADEQANEDQQGVGENGNENGPRRDNTRTQDDRNQQSKDKKKPGQGGDTGGTNNKSIGPNSNSSNGGNGQSDAGFGQDRVMLASFVPSELGALRVVPSVLLTSVGAPATGGKDSRNLQSVRPRGGGGSSGSTGGSRRSNSRTGGSSGGSSGSGGGRSFGLGDSKTGSSSGTDENAGDTNTGGSGRGRGRGAGGRGSNAGTDAGNGGSGTDSESGGTGGGRGRGRGSGRGGNDNASGGGVGRGGSGRDSGGSDSQPSDNADGTGNEDSNGDNSGTGAGGAGGGGGRGTPIESPVTQDDLPAMMDRLTTLPMPVIAGQINVNTAAVEVLRTLPGVGEAEAEAIVAKRVQLSGLDKSTPAWVATSGALPAEQFALISNLLTARSLQYTIESIGFADHVGAVKRIQAVVEFKGQLAQIKYYRDITSLGIGYPVRDDERSQGFAFTDR
jgi:type II secretory pathway component PulK